VEPTNTTPITRTHLQRTLLLGLCVSAFLLFSALLVVFRTIHQINEFTGTFADQQARGKDSIDAIQREQAELNERWRRLARKDVVRRDEILEQLEQNRAQMSSSMESAYEQAELLRESIYQSGHGLLRWTVWLFAICVGLSLACAVWAVRASAALFRRLEMQTDELTGLQYAFLETQENVARRFSHELHDELGQALTAIKANLSALRVDPEPRRVEDCMTLVDEAIRDVREMSQLLRPTVLDDFGLDAALRALVESFGQRTGIHVRYQSEMKGLRLSDAAETHLFRIAQEALTNVARHSAATSVDMEFRREGNSVLLKINDNGRGMQTKAGEPQTRGLGLAGMQTRARGCGGQLTIKSEPQKGFTIAVTCPLSAKAN
jgi:signal transduction histidine kinase